MYNLKVPIPVYGFDFHFFVMHWNIHHFCLKIIDKLLRVDINDANFANVQRNTIAFPDLVLNKTIFLIMMHDWYFSLASN